MNLKIMYEAKPSIEDLNILTEGIASYAKDQRDMQATEFFSFFVRDEKKQIKGGCNGIFYYGCMYLEQLWIDESIRYQGYGKMCVENAEKLAVKKHCSFATVTTMDWEALSFYVNLGYRIQFEMNGYSKNSTFYLLRKELFLVENSLVALF